MKVDFICLYTNRYSKQLSITSKRNMTSTLYLHQLQRINDKIAQLQTAQEEFVAQAEEKLHCYYRRLLLKRLQSHLDHSKQMNESVRRAQEENAETGRSGALRVGKIAGRYDRGAKYPVTVGYLNIVVTSINKSGLGSQLSPFCLRDEQNHIMENIWQFSKLYSSVPKVSATASNTWSWKAEIHDMNGEIQPNYWKWREAGMNHPDPVRSPVPKEYRGRCLCSIVEASDGAIERLDYMQARKRIYIPTYVRLARRTLDYDVLVEMLAQGYNLQILDFDGPTREDHSPYDAMIAGEYGEDGVGSLAIDTRVLEELLQDTMHPFGHGYVLAGMLLGMFTSAE
jgi:hypothetical protein